MELSRSVGGKEITSSTIAVVNGKHLESGYHITLRYGTAKELEKFPGKLHAPSFTKLLTSFLAETRGEKTIITVETKVNIQRKHNNPIVRPIVKRQLDQAIHEYLENLR